MDRNSPDFYVEDTAAGGSEMEAFVQHILKQTPAGLQHLQECTANAGAN